MARLITVCMLMSRVLSRIVVHRLKQFVGAEEFCTRAPRVHDRSRLSLFFSMLRLHVASSKPRLDKLLFLFLGATASIWMAWEELRTGSTEVLLRER